ncbi:MAG: hypothetical protein K6F64_09165 [Clostridia bacterium]|nr:hypothetical protein [Clostridia bacterium]
MSNFCPKCGEEIGYNMICPKCNESYVKQEKTIVSDAESQSNNNEYDSAITFDNNLETDVAENESDYNSEESSISSTDFDENDDSNKNNNKGKKKLIIPLLLIALVIIAGIICAIKYIPYLNLTDEEKAILKRTSKGYTLIKDSEIAKTDFVEISFSKAYISKEIEAIKAKCDNEDDAYIYIEGKIKNIGTSEYTVKGIDSEIIVDSLYTYKSTVYSDSTIKPNGEYDIIIYVSVPYATFNDFEYVEFKYAFNNNLESTNEKSDKKHFRFSSIFEEKDIWNAVEPERNLYVKEKLQEADALIEKKEYEKAYNILRDLPSSENIDKKKHDCEEKIIKHDYDDFENADGKYSIIMSKQGNLKQTVVNNEFWGEFINEAVLVLYKDRETEKYLPLRIKIGIIQSIYDGWIFADTIRITDGKKTVYIDVAFNQRTSETIKYNGQNILSESYIVELTKEQINDLYDIYQSDKVTYILVGSKTKEITVSKDLIESDRWVIEKAKILSTYEQ